jgi:hypothetical protein
MSINEISSQHHLPLFDRAASIAAKDEGINRAADNKASLLAFARKQAIEVAREKGEITMDDVAKRLVEKGVSVFALGNAAGSLFKGKQWQWTGRYRKSERVHAHSNPLKVWRLK